MAGCSLWGAAAGRCRGHAAIGHRCRRFALHVCPGKHGSQKRVEQTQPLHFVKIPHLSCGWTNARFYRILNQIQNFRRLCREHRVASIFVNLPRLLGPGGCDAAASVLSAGVTGRSGSPACRDETNTPGRIGAEVARLARSDDVSGTRRIVGSGPTARPSRIVSRQLGTADLSHETLLQFRRPPVEPGEHRRARFPVFSERSDHCRCCLPG